MGSRREGSSVYFFFLDSPQIIKMDHASSGSRPGAGLSIPGGKGG